MKYAWVPVNLPDGIEICVELREPPFMWTIIQIGTVSVDDSGHFTYSWRIIHPGNAELTTICQDNPTFTKYIETVINDRFEKLSNVEESNNGENLDVYEQSPFGIEKMESN